MKEYNLESLFLRKLHLDEQGNTCVRILWAGRFLKLKHPEYAINIARYLTKEGISFHLDMVGGGEMDEKLRQMTKKYHLEQEVTFHGYQSPKNVRRFMEEGRYLPLYQQLSGRLGSCTE